MHIYIYIYTYIYIHMYVYTEPDIYIYIYLFIYLFLHTFTYIHIHAHTYTYIHIHTFAKEYRGDLHSTLGIHAASICFCGSSRIQLVHCVLVIAFRSVSAFVSLLPSRPPSRCTCGCVSCVYLFLSTDGICLSVLIRRASRSAPEGGQNTV